MDIDKYTTQMQQKLIAKLLREIRALKAEIRKLKAEPSSHGYEEITITFKPTRKDRLFCYDRDLLEW